MKKFLILTRFKESLYAAFVVILAGIYSKDLSYLQTEYIVGFIIILFIAMGTYSINNYYDYRIDAENKRCGYKIYNPLVMYPIMKGLALKTGILLYTLAFFISLLLNFFTSIFILLNLPIFFLYNFRLKKKLLLKNIIAIYGFISILIFGSILIDFEIEPLIQYFILLSFILGLSFDFMMDIADLEGDKKFGIETIPVKFSKKTTAQICVSLYMIFMILGFLPFFVNIDQSLYQDPLYLSLFMITTVSYLCVSESLLKDLSKFNIGRLGRIALTAMLFNSIVFMIGVLI